MPAEIIKRGVITAYNDFTRELKVKLNNDPVINGANNNIITLQMPLSNYLANGLFIGSEPTVGSAVIVGQARGNKHYFVGFFSEKTSNIPKTKKD